MTPSGLYRQLRHSKPALAALLLVLAFLGNAAALPLFFGIQILLGSIPAVFALLLWRGWWGLAIGVAASTYTWKLWGHPWAILIFSGELLWLSLYVNRLNGAPKHDLNGRIILADIAYWLLVGAPLVFLFYGGILQFDSANVLVSAVKQSLNGVINTIIAFLLFLLLRLWRSLRGWGSIPLRGVMFSVVLVSITLPALLLTLVSSHQLERSTQGAVLEHLRIVGDATEQLRPERLTDPSQGLPTSVGDIAFRRVVRGGSEVSSNPELFWRLRRDFVDGGLENIHADGLRILIPRGNRPLLKKWVHGFWSVTRSTPEVEVQVVQPARSVVTRLQAQSAGLLMTLAWVLVLGAVASELLGSLFTAQLRPALFLHRGSGGARRAARPASVIAELRTLRQLLERRLRSNAHLRQDLAAHEQQLRSDSELLQLLESTDPLTGALNRAEFFRRLQRMADRSLRGGEPLSCVVFDLDGLQDINDRHGHRAGDEVLRRVATETRGLLHVNDDLFRVGGGEFVILRWGYPLESAQALAEQLRQRISQLEFPWAPHGPAVTISVGVSDFRRDLPGPEGLFVHGERALHQAKSSGRNQVKVR